MIVNKLSSNMRLNPHSEQKQSANKLDCETMGNPDVPWVKCQPSRPWAVTTSSPPLKVTHVKFKTSSTGSQRQTWQPASNGLPNIPFLPSLPDVCQMYPFYLVNFACTCMSFFVNTRKHISSLPVILASKDYTCSLVISSKDCYFFPLYWCHPKCADALKA